jgi:hypothetical protein
LGKPEGKIPLGKPRRRWVDNIEIYLRAIGWVVWAGSVWLRVGTSGGLLWTRWWTFGFHKILGSSWVPAQLAASQKGSAPWVSKWCHLRRTLVENKIVYHRSVDNRPGNAGVYHWWRDYVNYADWSREIS